MRRIHVFMSVQQCVLRTTSFVKGNNQENASYPVGLCAERVAVFAAGANYPGIKITATGHCCALCRICDRQTRCSLWRVQAGYR
jgi:cytidine deaminase